MKRIRKDNVSVGDYFLDEALESYYSLTKKTIREYVDELGRYCRYKSIVGQVFDGTVLDDRSRLIDLYDSCLIQDAHLKSVIETLESNMIGERYMLANHEGEKWIRNDKETEKIQGSQFEKIIKAILEKVTYGYSCIEIVNKVNPETGRLVEVNSIERRNILPNQHRVVKRVRQWNPGWDLDNEQYRHNYILFNDGELGLFSATTPLILAKKFTIANWVNFAHTYGQPIIHGKTGSEDPGSRNRLAGAIANAAQKKVLVTGKDDEVDIKTFTMSNSEQIYDKLQAVTKSEISNLILGSESMAGETQSYVGSTKAHEEILRTRLKKYRRIVENEMNEKVLPVLKYWGIIAQDVFFKYSKQMEMSEENKIKLYDMLTDKYEISGETINDEFGVQVGNQIVRNGYSGGSSFSEESDYDEDGHRMSDEEYFKRYGHHRDSNGRVNFL